MALWDVRLDSISMINLIMCIGFSVDFTAHICYTFMSSPHKDPKERVRDSLYSLGLPIVQGSFSTILSVFALILADSYIFLVFFKMVFLVVFFGAMHGLFLLPVLLSLFGPGSCSRRSHKEKEKDDQISEVEKSLPYPYCIPHPSLVGHNWDAAKTKNWEFAEKQNNNFIPNKNMAPYLPTLPTHMMITTYERSSPMLEKDLGLGTSGEDSSETASGSGQFEMTKEDEKQRRIYEEGWRKPSVDKDWNWRNRTKDGYSNDGYLSDDEKRSPKLRSYKNSDFELKQKYQKNENVRKRSSTPTGIGYNEKLENTRQYLEAKRKGDSSRDLRKFSRDFSRGEAAPVRKYSSPVKMENNLRYFPHNYRSSPRYSADDSQLEENKRGRQVFRRFSQHETYVRPRSRSQHAYDDF